MQVRIQSDTSCYVYIVSHIKVAFFSSNDLALLRQDTSNHTLIEVIKGTLSSTRNNSIHFRHLRIKRIENTNILCLRNKFRMTSFQIAVYIIYTLINNYYMVCVSYTWWTWLEKISRFDLKSGHDKHISKIKKNQIVFRNRLTYVSVKQKKRSSQHFHAYVIWTLCSQADA